MFNWGKSFGGVNSLSVKYINFCRYKDKFHFSIQTLGLIVKECATSKRLKCMTKYITKWFDMFNRFFLKLILILVC